MSSQFLEYLECLGYDLEQTWSCYEYPYWVSAMCLGVFWDNIKTNRLTKPRYKANRRENLSDLNMAQLSVVSGGPGTTAPDTIDTTIRRQGKTAR